MMFPIASNYFLKFKGVAYALMWKWGKHGSNDVGEIYDLLVRKIRNPCCV